MKKKEIITTIVTLLVVASVIIILEVSNERVGSGSTKDTEISVQNVDTQIQHDLNSRYPRAHEISTPDAFLNSEPFTLESLLVDHVVLVDFWTYSCINCQRTTPYLNAWHEAYADEGLVIVGIHTPEFNFEKDIQNVTDAVERLSIKYPVVIDNDYSTWRSYQNRFWPRKYLIDSNGYIVYDRIGEGAYDVTEMKIVEAINNLRKQKGLELLSEDDTISNPEEVASVTFGSIESPETYFGYDREEYLVVDEVIFASALDTCKDTVCTYPASEKVRDIGTYTLVGAWLWGSESITSMQNSSQQIPTIETVFGANIVNIVTNTETTRRARVFLDGKPIPSTLSGKDVANSVVEFNGARLYEIVNLQGKYENHELTIEFFEGPIEVFTFTFG